MDEQLWLPSPNISRRDESPLYKDFAAAHADFTRRLTYLADSASGSVAKQFRSEICKHYGVPLNIPPSNHQLHETTISKWLVGYGNAIIFMSEELNCPLYANEKEWDDFLNAIMVDMSIERGEVLQL